MRELNDSEIQSLKSMALDATQGRWNLDFVNDDRDSKEARITAYYGSIIVKSIEWNEDSLYISSARPEIVLNLINELEKREEILRLLADRYAKLLNAVESTNVTGKDVISSMEREIEYI